MKDLVLGGIVDRGFWWRHRWALWADAIRLDAMYGGGGCGDRIEGDEWRNLEAMSGVDDRRWRRRRRAGNMNGS